MQSIKLRIFLFAILMPLFCFAGWTSRTFLNPMSVRPDYGWVGNSGIIANLASDKGLSPFDPLFLDSISWIGNLVSTPILKNGTVHAVTRTGVGNFLLERQKVKSDLAILPVNLPGTTFRGMVKLGDTIIVVMDTVGRLDGTSLTPLVLPTGMRTSDVMFMAVDGNTLIVTNAKGSVIRMTMSGNSLVQAGYWSQNIAGFSLLFGPLPITGSEYLAGIAPTGAILTFISGVWSTIPGYIFPDAVHAQVAVNGGIAELLVVCADGRWVLMDLNNRKLLNGGPSYFSGWTKVDGTSQELASLVSGFAVFGKESKVWGITHHIGGLSDETLFVTPSVFSPLAKNSVQLDVALTTSSMASMKVSVVSYSSETDTVGSLVKVIQDWHTIIYGGHFESWNGRDLSENIVADGRYGFKVEMIDLSDAALATDTIRMQKSFYLDATPPIGNLSSMLKGENQTMVWLEGDTIPFVNPSRAFCVVLDSVADAMFADSLIQIEFTLTSRAGAQNTWNRSKSSLAKDTVCLDGYDQRGVALPNGVYLLQIKAKDIAGNTRLYPSVPWSIESITKNVTGVGIRKSERVIEGSFRPQLLLDQESISSLDFNIGGRANEKLTVNITLNNAQIWQDTVRLDSNMGAFRKTITREWRSISITGLNYAKINVEDSLGDRQSLSVPIILDQFQTKITYPLEGEIIQANTPLRGVATAPQLNTKGGFSRYRVYAIKGTPAIDRSKIKSIESLFSQVSQNPADWNPIAVPFVRQSQNVISSTPNRIHDADYPNSNIGGVDATGQTDLAIIQPEKLQDGAYTLLLVSEQKGDTAISFDFVHVQIKNVPVSSIVSLVIDSNSTKAHSGILNRTNADKTDDTLEYGLKLKNASAWAKLTLVEGLLNEPGSHRQLLQENLYLPAEVSVPWIFKGKNAYGLSLSDGLYSLVIEILDEVTRTYIKQVIPLQCIMPAIPDANKVITLNPDPLLIVDSSDSRVQISVKMPAMTAFALFAENDQTQKRYLIGTSTGAQEGNWYYDLKDSTGSPLYSENNGQSLIRFALYPLDGMSWNPIFDTLTVITNAYVLFDTTFGMDPSGIWVPDLKSGFKFRGVMHAEMKYFPKRIISTSPYVKGHQVVRKMIPFNYHVNFSKYYNSIEAATDWYYRFRIRRPGSSEGSTRKNREGISLSSHYAFESSRGNVSPIHDSSLVKSYPVLAYGDLNYFDATSWSDQEKKFVNHTCGVPTLIKGNNSIPEYKNSDRCRAHALSVSVEKTAWSHFWKEMPDRANLISYFLKNPGSTPDSSDLGARFYMATGLGSRNRTVFNNGIQPTMIQGILAQEPSDCKSTDWETETFPNGCYPGRTLFFRNRDEAFGSAGFIDYSYLLGNSDDEWDRDAKSQMTYTFMPIFDWTHPYLLQNGRVNYEANYYSIQQMEKNVPDPRPWAENRAIDSCPEGDRREVHYPVQRRVDGDEDWYTVKDAYTDTLCFSEGGGKKLGQRGFSIKSDTTYESKSTGNQYHLWDIFNNYFNREKGSGHVFWNYSQTDEENDDNISVSLKGIQIDNRLMGITWDTVTIEFPSQGLVEQNGSPIEQNGSGRKNVFCADTSEAWKCFNHSPWFQEEWPTDTSTINRQYYAILKSPVFAESNGNATAIDSVYLDFRTRLKSVLDSTDTALHVPTGSLSEEDVKTARLYKYLSTRNGKSLLLNMAYKGAAIRKNGQYSDDILAVDQANPYVEYRTVANKDSLGAWVLYLNQPTQLPNWSSDQDSMFANTNGYLYGSGNFNEKQFRKVDNALPQVGEHGGILQYVTSLGWNSRMSLASPDNLAPFVLNQQGLPIFNPNLMADKVNWNMEVFQYDGEEAHNVLDTAGSSKNNFVLQLSLKGTPKNYVRIQHQIPGNISKSGNAYDFKYFRVCYIDTIGIKHWMPVNPAYRSKTNSDRTKGDVLPDYHLDFWNRVGNSEDTIPSLAFWDVTRKGGKFKLLIEAVYQVPGQGSEVYLVRWNRNLQVGTVMPAGNPDSIVTINSAYMRSSLEMPSGAAQPGSSLAIYPVDIADLELSTNLPDFIPTGPVIEIVTDGNRVFSGEKPKLKYRYNAQEIYELEGDGDLKTDSYETIENKLEQYGGRYHLYLLGENGRLDPMATVVGVFMDGTDETNSYVELTADLDHFSYAFVMKDVKKKGRIPKLDYVELEGDSILITGRYGYGFAPDSILFNSSNLPNDLVLIVSGKDKLSEALSNVKYTRTLSVDSASGAFKVKIDRTKVLEGNNYVYLMYQGDSKADKRLLLSPYSTLWFNNWNSKPNDVIRPSCGSDVQSTYFWASKQGTLTRSILNQAGDVLSQSSVSFIPGQNKITWDGCIDAHELSNGRFYLSFKAKGDTSAYVLGVDIGLDRLPQLTSINVTARTYVPSPNQDAWQKIEIKTYKLLGTQFDLAIRKPNGQIVSLNPVASGTRGNEYTYVAEWSGVGEAVGEYTALAWLPNTPATPIEATFQLTTPVVTPVVDLSILPNALTFPVRGAIAQMNSNIPLRYTLQIEDASSQVLQSLRLQDSANSGITRVPWTWTDSTRLPSQMRLIWHRTGSGAGEIVKPLVINGNNLKIDDVQFQPQDTLYPDYPENRQDAVGKKMANMAVYTFKSNTSGRVKLRIASGIPFFEIEQNIYPGLNSVSWNGKDKQGKLMNQGSYVLTLFSIPNISGLAPSQIARNSVYLKRLPDVGICASAANKNLANSVVTQLQYLGVTSTQVMDYTECKSYMSYRKDGISIYLDAPLADELYKCGEQDLVSSYVAYGGNAVFLNGLPLHECRTSSGVQQTGGRQFILFGASPFNTDVLNGLWNSYRGKSIVSNTDQSQAENLTWWNANSNLVSEYPALNRRYLDSIGAVVIPIQGGEEEWLHSFYTKVPNMSGTILSLYPFGMPVQSGTNQSLLASDIGKTVWQYYFAEDLRIHSVKIDSAGKNILRNGTVILNATVDYFGEQTLNNLTVEIRSKSNNNYYQAISNISVSKGHPFTIHHTYVISDLADLDVNDLEIKVLPFLYTVNSQTVMEKNTGNNIVKLKYMVADISKPVIQLDTITGMTLNRHYSGLPGSYPFFMAGKIQDDSKGAIAVSYAVRKTTGNQDIVWQTKENLQGNSVLNPFRKKLNERTVTDLDKTLLLTVTAKDKFGNESSLDAQIVVDRSIPSITSWRVKSPIISTDSSAAIAARLAGGDTLISVESDTAITYYVGKGSLSTIWSGFDSIGIDSLEVIGEDGVVDSLALTTAPKNVDGQALNGSYSAGLLALRILDRAGNSDTAYAVVVRDTIAPILSLCKTILNLADSIRLNATYLPKYVVKNPLYLHILEDKTDTLEQGDGLPQVNPKFATNLGQGQTTVDIKLDADMDTLPVVLTAFDDALESVTMTWNVPMDPLQFNPYIRVGDPLLLSNTDLRNAIRNNKGSYILRVPVLQQTQEISFVATDASGNKTTLNLHLKGKTRDSWDDLEGDRTDTVGADFGAVYAGYENKNGGLWYHFMIHSYANYVGRSAMNYLYLDMDGDNSTGTTPDSLLNLSGFEKRIAWNIIDSTDRPDHICAILEGWTSSQGWFAQKAIGCGTDSLNLNATANQYNRLYTPSLGFGDQVLADNRIAQAPGGVVELSFLADQGLPDTLHWVIQGENDVVYDTVLGIPNGLIAKQPLSIVADGHLGDWWASQPPARASLAQLDAELVENSLSGNTRALQFNLANRGYTIPDTTILVQLFEASICAELPKVSGGSPDGSFEVYPNIVRANTMEQFLGMDDHVYALKIRLAKNILTPGTRFHHAPAVNVWGGCISQMEPLSSSNATTIIPWKSETFLGRSK